MVEKQGHLSPPSSHSFPLHTFEFSGHPIPSSNSTRMAITMTRLFSITLPSNNPPFISSSFLHPHRPHCRSVAAQSKGSDSADLPDRLISAVVYFYPFFDGVQYGNYVISQFPPFQAALQPLVPAIRVYNGFLVFLTLYFVVVRNPNFTRYVRFNTMQAIVLDILLIFPDLLERTLNPRDGVGLDLLMSLDSTVFLFLLVCLLYGSSSCLLGQLPRLPLVAEAADRQVF